MKVNTIALDEDELPESITVTMSLAEVVVIARWTGGLSDRTSPAPAITGDIYDALVGGVVNRFWDDGMNDLKRVPLPVTASHDQPSTESEEANYA